jgi:hypothetical protein
MSEDERRVQRQAFAGMLWSKRFYFYEIEEWLAGDPAGSPPPDGRQHGRNSDWKHLHNADILSMPDKWEYPWYAAWDLAFHCIPLAMVDPDFAKRQLVLMLREWYMHPKGQIPVARQHPVSRVLPRRQRSWRGRQPPDRLDRHGRQAARADHDACQLADVVPGSAARIAACFGVNGRPQGLVALARAGDLAVTILDQPLIDFGPEIAADLPDALRREWLVTNCHQGPVWTWLMGAYVEAHYRIHHDRATGLDLLRPFAHHLRDACLGSMSEILEGDAPHLPRGAIAKARGVVEVLRVLRTLGTAA